MPRRSLKGVTVYSTVTAPEPEFSDVPDPFRGPLIEFAKEARKKRPGLWDILDALTGLHVAYSDEDCGCRHVPEAARRWLHPHHQPYSETVIELLPEELRTRLIRLIEKGPSRPMTDGPRGAQSVRLLQDWLIARTPGSQGRMR